MNNLFTYGTLMYEEENPTHGFDLDDYLIKTIRGQVKGDLYVVEGFPFLDIDGDGVVKGKMYIFSDIEPCLDIYDKIEGANDVEPFFERREVDVQLSDGSTENAYCYVGGKSLIRCFARPEYKIESGDWSKIEQRWR